MKTKQQIIEEIVKRFDNDFHSTSFCNKHEIYPCKECGTAKDFLSHSLEEVYLEAFWVGYEKGVDVQLAKRHLTTEEIKSMEDKEK